MLLNDIQQTCTRQPEGTLRGLCSIEFQNPHILGTTVISFYILCKLVYGGEPAGAILYRIILCHKNGHFMSSNQSNKMILAKFCTETEKKFFEETSEKDLSDTCVTLRVFTPIRLTSRLAPD